MPIFIVSLIIVVGLNDGAASAYKSIFLTPAGDNYYFMEDYGQSIEGKTSLKFQVQACSNVHVLLMQDRHDFDENIYEIRIGGHNNTQTEIRKVRNGNASAVSHHKALNCNQLQSFLISWEHSMISAGMISAEGVDVFISVTDEMRSPVNFFSIATGYPSTGHWIFDSSFFTSECCSYAARDCYDVFDNRERLPGVFSVTPEGTHTSFEVFCDLGGWLVFQRRIDGSENFFRNWADYKMGFGNISREHWLGNDHLYDIVSQGRYELRIDMEDFDGNKRYAAYDIFKIGSASEKYKLMVGQYSGDAGDSLTVHQGCAFSTKDADTSGKCAKQFEGAWWYKGCHESNLNGRYLNGSHSSYANGVNWRHWKGYNYSLKTTEMKIRRI